MVNGENNSLICEFCNTEFYLVGENATGIKIFKCKCNRLIEIRK